MEGLPITKTRFRASSTVEIILAISLFMMYGTFIIGALAYSISTTKIPNTQKSAIQFANQGIEAVRYIRKTSLGNLTNGTYGLNNSGTEWTLVATPETLDSIYTRSISITAPSASEKLVTATVAWSNAGRSGTESITALFSDWQDTILPVFSPWEVPTFAMNYPITATTYDVTYLKIFDGVMYGTLRNGTTSSYTNTFTISGYPTITNSGSLNIGALDTDTAYRAPTDGETRFYYSSANNSNEVRGVNKNTNTLIGAYNMSGNLDANGIAANGDLLYVTRTANGATLEFNVIQNTGNSTYTVLGTVNYTSTLYDVLLRDTNYAYVTTANTSAELLVMNISNSATPVISSTINLPTTLTGRYNLAMSGDYLIIYKSTGTVTGMSIYIYDCTNPGAPTLASSYLMPYLVYDVDVDPVRSLIFAVSNKSAAEFEVIDYTNPALPVRRGFYNASSATYRSVAWDPSNDRAYIGTTDNTNEIVILNNN